MSYLNWKLGILATCGRRLQGDLEQGNSAPRAKQFSSFFVHDAATEEITDRQLRTSHETRDILN